MRKFTIATVAASAIGVSALLTIGAPAAHASPKSDCDAKGGTYSETTIVDNKTGKTGTVYRCCVKDSATNTTSCDTTTVTAAENVSPTGPITRIPLGVLTTAVEIEQAS